VPSFDAEGRNSDYHNCINWKLFSLLLHPPPDREDLLIADLHECGTTGITEEDAGLRAFFEADQDANGLAGRFAEYSPEFRQEQPADWEQLTRDAWPPMSLGERFFLVAPWHDTVATPPGRLRLEIYPGMACGTGRHPATQLCLQAIERCVKPGARVLDVGSGSGILSDAARLMGAAQVTGCDIDEDNVRIARERVPVAMFVGSADAVQSGWADIVIANIDAATLDRIAPDLARVQKPGSKLILSGFPEWDLPERFSPQQILEQEEWRCFICVHPCLSVAINPATDEHR
jgi:ribosomal protein L11 methyltransferase